MQNKATKKKHVNCISKIKYLKTLPARLLMAITDDMLPCKECNKKNKGE